VTLREAIRALGPTIDFLPSARAFAYEADPPPENLAKQETQAVLRNQRSAAARERELTRAADSSNAIAR
jgi:hypothetical protein